MKRSFYQMHSCEGYSAKVTVEWQAPGTINGEYAHDAEDVADEVFAKIGARARDIVQAMRGKR